MNQDKIRRVSTFPVETHIASFDSLDESTLYDIFRLRKQAFIDRRQWDINSYDGSNYEFDSYDDPEAHYLFSWSTGITGCIRLRPSTSPTLLTGPLEFLKPGEQKGESDTCHVWEASRFFITRPCSTHVKKDSVKGIDPRTFSILIGMLEFGKMNGIQAFEVVLDTFMLRVVRRCGWSLQVKNSGRGSLDEIIHYGLLNCDELNYNSVKTEAKRQVSAG